MRLSELSLAEQISHFEARFRPLYSVLAGSEPWLESCKEHVFKVPSVSELRDYVENIIKRAEAGSRSAAEEALHVALPLVYRVALDDTSANQRLAVRLQDVACRTLLPDFHHAMHACIAGQVERTFGVTYGKLDELLVEVLEVAGALGGVAHPVYAIYGRKKAPTSIFLKFFRYLVGAKVPKAGLLSEVEGRQFAATFFQLLEGELDGRVEKAESSDRRTFECLIPDLLGVTVQYDDNFGGGRLGVARRRYKRVANLFSHDPRLEARAGPFFSRHWHMNRLALHAQFLVGSPRGVPVEVLVRTNLDYFLGYANYWRYKELAVLDKPGSERPVRREQLKAQLRECQDFGEVQELLLRELQGGQLPLF